MAEIKILLKGVANEDFEVKELLRFELVRDIDAVCDGLNFTFLCSEKPFEADKVTVFISGKKVFYGVCDKQRYNRNEKGFEVFIYARSCGAVLLDNEALPASYNMPSASLLFHREAEKYGFKNNLPEITSKHIYTVGKGTTCYGAINNFIKALTSKDVLVSADGELYLPDGKGVVDLCKEKIISESFCINRAKPVAKIDYKVDGDTAYIRHYKSRFLEERKISKSRKTDVSSLPLWQREVVLRDKMAQSAAGYYEIKYIVHGLLYAPLYDKAVCGASGITEGDSYRLCRTVLVQNESGAVTHIVFRKEFDFKEVNYVAE